MVGGQDELIFDGSSFAVSKEGNLLSQAKSFEEELQIINLDLPKELNSYQFQERKKFLMLYAWE